ncbi:MAG: hypothetical protein OXC98_01475 [bacterium]|nr:hypothetical protein [Acidimicrobiia bacterium]MCY4649026.1 hypothetical protein [bacterium]
MPDFIDGVSSGIQEAWQDVITFVPKFIGALVILFVGWLVARIVYRGASRLLQGVGLDRLLERAGLGERIKSAEITAADLVARAIYWFLLLVVLLLAAQTLEVDHLSSLLSALISYLPLVVVAIIIVIVASAIGAFLAEVSTPWSRDHSIRWLPEVARWMVIGFGALAALNTLNIAEEIVNTLFIAVVSTVGVSIAIAFGVGGIPVARKWWERILPDRD